MKIISVGTLKGGVGKTNVVFNLAGVLAFKGYKVLCIDCDAQANLTNNFYLKRIIKNRKTVINLFEEDAIPASEVIMPTGIEGIDIVPSHIMLTATELTIASYTGREYLLRNWIKKNRSELAMYDYVLIDTNPSFNICNQNAFIVADSIVLITDPDINGYDGLLTFMSLWDKIRNRLDLPDTIKAVIVNKYERVTKYTREFLENIENDFDIKNLLIVPYIPNSARLKETASEAKPIPYWSQSVKGVTAAFSAYLDIIPRLEEKGVL